MEQPKYSKDFECVSPTNQPRKALIPKVFGWSGQQYDYIREIRDIRNVIPLINSDMPSGKSRAYKERKLAPDFEGSDKSVLSKPDQLSVSSRPETFNKWNHPLTEAMVITGRRPKFNMATMSYSPATHKAYFTVNLPVPKGHHSAEAKRLGIAESDFYNGYCQHFHYLYFDTGFYNTMHPAISPDGQILVFSSNRLGGKGRFDLYYVVKDSSGWGAIHALDAINTSGNEVFPNFTSDGTLYFSSDGRQGLGGLDIYKVKLDIMHGDDIVEHLGYPINGAYDDFGWTEDSNGSFGFFSSNRSGSDDIFSFKKALPQMMLSGVILRKTDSLMFSGVGIVLFVKSGQYWNTVGNSITRQGGHFQFIIKPGRSYLLQVSFNGVSLMKTVDSPSIPKDIYLGKIYLKNPN